MNTTENERIAQDTTYHDKVHSFSEQTLKDTTKQIRTFNMKTQTLNTGLNTIAYRKKNNARRKSCEGMKYLQQQNSEGNVNRKNNSISYIRSD